MSEGPKRKYDGIAVCGSHPVTVEMAPFGDPNWLIWVCSSHNIEHRTLPRWDAWFELHDPISDPTRAYDYLRWLESHDKCEENSDRSTPVFMRDKAAIKNFPTGVLYPEEKMKKIYGPFVWTSTIAYMLALAIEECKKHDIPAVGLFGIMQASENEYTYQRPAIQQLIWESQKAGLDCIAPDISMLFEPQKAQW